MALNARQETFARLVALATMSNAEAARQAGYSAKAATSTAVTLQANPSIAARIDSLRSEQQQLVAAKQLVTREKLVEWLVQLASKAKGEMAKLKAIELLAKMQGYNEPAAVQHSHVHLQVDAGLMEQLKAGHAALLAKQVQALPAPQGGTPGGQATPSIERHGEAGAEGEGSKNIYSPEEEAPPPENLHTPKIHPAPPAPENTYIQIIEGDLTGIRRGPQQLYTPEVQADPAGSFPTN